ncbi:MAG: endolytic transglycosylase MltG [Bacilli bacterium]|nr:endolytic transglycosylase MltG [Bacilli bacterium]
MKKKKKAKPLLFILIIAFLLIIIGGTILFLTGPVNAFDKKDVEVQINSGTSSDKIGDILKEKGLIRSKSVFKLYLKIKKVNNLKASTYLFNKSMNLDSIIKKLQEGSEYNPNLVVITFKEGKRITDYAKLIDSKTNNSYDDVINTISDKDYISELISKYWFLTDDILDSNIYYPLEGYLAPETYHFDNKDVTVKEIIETMLKQEEKHLEKYKSKMSSNPHYYITMASIVELEGTNTENRKMIVGIFENRLNIRMNLGSDVTTYYGLQVAMTSDLNSEQFSSDNMYNTRNPKMSGKMPIGPICSISESSIEASVNPTKNDYLYFVADKKGKIYYTKTLAEHNQKITEIKNNGDWIW